jgi:hypothetical protein
MSGSLCVQSKNAGVFFFFYSLYEPSFLIIGCVLRVSLNLI